MNKMGGRDGWMKWVDEYFPTQNENLLIFF